MSRPGFRECVEETERRPRKIQFCQEERGSVLTAKKFLPFYSFIGQRKIPTSTMIPCSLFTFSYHREKYLLKHMEQNFSGHMFSPAISFERSSQNPFNLNNNNFQSKQQQTHLFYPFILFLPHCNLSHTNIVSCKPFLSVPAFSCVQLKLAIV